MNIITERIQLLSEQIVNGEVTPLTAYRLLREWNDLTKELMDGIKESALAELREAGGKYEDERMTVTVQNGAGRWDFSHIPAWNTLKEQIKLVEEDAKGAFKAWEKGKQVIDDQGEVIQPGNYKAAGETLTFKFKKK